MLKRGHAAETLLAAVIAACGIAPASGAAPDKEYSFNIPKQPLSQAILVFDTQAGLSGGVLSDTKEEASIVVGPLRGSYTADRALKELLKHTDFEYAWISNDTISVYKKISSGNANAQTTGESPLPTSLLYQDHGGLNDWGGPGDIVIVIGTRLSLETNEAQSTTVISQRKIESYGVSTLPELMQYLPQIPYSRPAGYRQSGEQFVNLRGLGPGTTLVLINGQRTAPSATGFDLGGFDMNTIPLTAVKRIEVLLDSPSIAAGMDAVGGIVNIVLKDEIDRPLAELRVGGASGGASERRASLGFGSTRNSFHGAVTIDALQRDSLMGSERDLTRNQDYRRFGGIDMRLPQSSLGNISSPSGANLPGLNSSFAAVPEGLTAGTLTPNDFAATAGQRNLASWSSFTSIIPESSRTSLVASGELELPSNLTAFAQVLGTETRTEYTYGPPAISGIVSASNPFNPFGVPVVTTNLLTSMKSREAITDRDFARASGGVRGAWANWTGEAGVTWTHERATLSNVNDLNPIRVMTALASSDPTKALDVFHDAPPGSDELLASLVADPRVQRYLSESTAAYLRARGPLISLPAGPLQLMTGGEWREETLANLVLPTTPRRTTSAAFVELDAPIVSPSMEIPALEQVALSLGARVDDYSDIGRYTERQYGLVWRPLTDLKLQTTFSETYRPPFLYELFAPQITTPITLADPKRNGQITTFVAIAGGNPNLVSSPGHSWTSSVKFTPQSIPELRLSATYWRTALDKNISQLPLPTLMAYSDVLHTIVKRAPPSPQDIAAGIPGVLQSVEAFNFNLGRLRAEGMDFDASHGWSTRAGHLSTNLSATWVDHFRSQAASELPVTERVGVTSLLGTIPRWRIVATIEWAHGPFTLTSGGRFISHFDDTSYLDGTRLGRTIPSQTFMDAQAVVQLDSLVPGAAALDSVKLTAGAMNLLNAAPHFSQYGFDGYDAAQGDIRQRFWYLRLSKEFH
jgi:iron complex outermembrane receptor protein